VGKLTPVFADERPNGIGTRTAFCLAVFLLAGPVSGAQDNPCLNRTIPVSVTTEEGLPVKGLTATNFRGKFRGRPLKIVSAIYEAGPRRVVILLDTSGSMVSESFNWKPGLMVAQDLVSSAPPQVSLALLTFEHHTQKHIDFGQGRGAFADALAKLGATDWSKAKGWRKTALLDAMLQGITLLKPTRTGDALYLITDGDDNASQTDAQQVKQALLSIGARVFSFILPGDYPRQIAMFGRRVRPPEQRLDRAELHDLIRAVGGDFMDFYPQQHYDPAFPRDFQPTKRDGAAILFASRGLTPEIGEFYRLELKLPETVDRVRDWNLEVVEPNGKSQSSLRLLYPHSLAPCQ
jgi:hypothetical protein